MTDLPKHFTECVLPGRTFKTCKRAQTSNQATGLWLAANIKAQGDTTADFFGEWAGNVFDLANRLHHQMPCLQLFDTLVKGPLLVLPIAVFWATHSMRASNTQINGLRCRDSRQFICQDCASPSRQRLSMVGFRCFTSRHYPKDKGPSAACNQHGCTETVIRQW